MTLAELIARAETQLREAIAARQTAQDALMALRADPNLTEEAVNERASARDAADATVTARQNELNQYRAELAREEEIQRSLSTITPNSGSPAPAQARATATVHVGREERMYAANKDRGFVRYNDNGKAEFRSNAKPGAQFERDVFAAFILRDFAAEDNLRRHMQEERVERAAYLTGTEVRAAGTGAFAGLTVPQYLTDFYAPMAAAGRPLADAMEHHDLPEAGMSVNISRITTATSAALQASENTNVSETDIDDTLLTIPVQTNAGQQTISRQALERGSGVEPVVMNDLFRRYNTVLDSTLINQATTGLAAVANAVTYTDASPTVAELYPYFAAALANIESTMLDMATGENLVVMHGRRWWWMTNALSTSWPIIGQPGIESRNEGMNYANAYGRGYKGLLPNSTPVVGDNNVATNLGAGTNQDEIYVVDQHECHLWEDPDAPLFLRAEQTKAASLGVLFVMYGYFAYTFSRYAHAQRITGTGLITPTFTGV